MPHDKNGNPLAVGDRVTVECVVKSVSPGPDFCNLSIQSVEGRKPDGQKEYMSLNAAVVVKAGPAPAAALFGGLNPLLLVEYAGQINAAVTALLNAGLPKLLVADKCLHVVIEGLQAGKSAAEVAADLVTRWKAGGLSG